MKNFVCSLSLVVIVFNASTASASLAVWGTAQNTLVPSNVSTNGNLVAAFNGGVVDATVNGTTFLAASPFTFAANSFLASADTGDLEFNKLLDQNSFNFSPNPNDPNTGQGTIDLGSFTVGKTYEIQVFFTDQRSNSNDRSVLYGTDDGIGIGVTVELFSDPNGSLASPFGQFAIGTFVADGNDPDLVVTAGVNHNSAQINAWQIREITVVPEPAATTFFTMLLGIGGALHVRRRLGRP